MTVSKMINGQRLIDTLRRYRHETISIEGLEALISQMESAQSVDKDINVPDNDTISRQGVLRLLNAVPSEEFVAKAMLISGVMVLPSVTPKQPKRKKGRWIERESGTEDKENGFETVIVCSCCDFPATTFYSEDCESRTQIRTDFCPNCGADMRGNDHDKS